MANLVEVSLLQNFIDKVRVELSKAGVDVDNINNICDIPEAVKKQLEKEPIGVKPVEAHDGILSGSIITTNEKGEDFYVHDRFVNITGGHDFKVNGLAANTQYIRLLQASTSIPVYIDCTPLKKSE